MRIRHSNSLRYSLLLAAAAVLAACGSTSSSGSTTTYKSTTTTIAPSVAIVPIPATDLSLKGTWGKEPTVKPPASTASGQLEVTDLIVGTGTTVAAGSNITVQYVGFSTVNNKIFDDSWTRASDAFTLDSTIILGWQKGLVGMKVGGRRELIIPPSLAYGATPPLGSQLAPNDTLVFIVDLLSSP